MNQCVRKQDVCVLRCVDQGEWCRLLNYETECGPFSAVQENFLYDMIYDTLYPRIRM